IQAPSHSKRLRLLAAHWQAAANGCGFMDFTRFNILYLRVLRGAVKEWDEKIARKKQKKPAGDIHGHVKDRFFGG
ncbi:MAG: hypothetical protein ABSA26_13860, partial [Thermoguttaceae bacterium]